MLTAGDVYELAISQTYQGSNLVNVHHFTILPATLTSPQTKFQTLADDCKELFRGQQAAEVTYTGWKAQQVAGAGVSYSTTNCRRSGGDVYEGAHTGTLTGGISTGTANPSYEAAVVALKTGFAGRSRRGAIYVGGFHSNQVDASDPNKVNSVTLGLLATALASFLTKYGTSSPTDPSFGWSVFSRFIASGCKYVPAIPKPVLTHVQAGDAAASVARVQSATTRVLWAPMRRRKEGRGS